MRRLLCQNLEAYEQSEPWSGMYFKVRRWLANQARLSLKLKQYVCKSSNMRRPHDEGGLDDGEDKTAVAVETS